MSDPGVAQAPRELADVTEQLMQEFSDDVAPTAVLRAVAESLLSLQAAGVEFGIVPATEAAARFRLRHRGRAGERRDLHNSEVDDAVGALGLCGTVHLPTGRLCLLPHRHPGSCDFQPRLSGDGNGTARTPAVALPRQR